MIQLLVGHKVRPTYAKDVVEASSLVSIEAAAPVQRGRLGLTAIKCNWENIGVQHPKLGCWVDFNAMPDMLETAERATGQLGASMDLTVGWAVIGDLWAEVGKLIHYLDLFVFDLDHRLQLWHVADGEAQRRGFLGLHWECIRESI